MKHRVVYVVLACAFCWIVLSSRSGGLAQVQNQDRTGSPFSVGNCSGCHGGGSFGTVTVSATIKDQGTGTAITAYEPGVTYDLEIQLSNTAGSPVRYGMQSVILEDAGNTTTGTLSGPSANGRISTLGGRSYFEQDGGTGSLFTIDWTAPTAGTDEITLYATGLAGNGGGTGGDNSASQITLALDEAVTGVSATADTVVDGNNTTITTTIAGGTTPITYNLLDSNNVVIATNASGVFTQAFGCGITTIKVSAFNTGTSNPDTFSLNVLVLGNPSSVSIDTSICQGEVYSFNGTNYTATGTYFDTIQDISGCDSVAFIIDLTAHDTFTTAISNAICNGNVFFFNGNNLITAGMYRDTLMTVNGCDSFIELTLSVNDTFRTPASQTICQGETFSFNGQNLSTAGNYMDTLATVDGCDSIIELTLTVNDTFRTLLAQSICQGEVHVFDGQNLTTPGTYYDTLTTINGCDSILELTLTVNDTFRNSLAQTICAGQTFSFGGNTLSTAGIYYDTFSTVFGCDSICELTLTVNDTDRVAISTTICRGQIINFGSNTITSSGLYLDTLANTDGCDSIIELTVTLNDTFRTVVNRSICQGDIEVFNGQNLSMTGTYLDTLATVNGCDSVIELRLSVNDTFRIPVAQTICAGQTFSFNGQNLVSTGIYLDTLQSISLCDSIIELTLTVNDTFRVNNVVGICAGQTYMINGKTYDTTDIYFDTLSTVNGCDSIIVTDLQVTDTIHITLNQSICQGEVFIFNGISRSTTGVYSDTNTSSGGCDSITTVNLSVNDTFRTPFSQTICAGQTISFNGHTLSTAGIYLDTLPTVFGCDSVLELTLIVNDTFRTSTSQTICAGETFAFNGNQLTSSGVYLDTLATINSCDSIIELTLTVNDTFRVNNPVTICQGQSYTINGNTYNSSGIYLDTFLTVDNCDSILVTDLTVTNTITSTINQTICAGEVFNFAGTPLFLVGAYFDTTTASGGCDSITVLNLFVNDTSRTSLTQTICEGLFFVFNGNQLTTPGTYLDTLSNSLGCDSIVQLELAVNDTHRVPLSFNICAGSSIIVNGTTYSSAGEFDDVISSSQGCDSTLEITISVGDTFNGPFIDSTICLGDTVIIAGNVVTSEQVIKDSFTASTTGCDSFVTYSIFVDSNCVRGIEDLPISYINNFNVFPNPVVSELTVEGAASIQSVLIMDLMGKTVLQQEEINAHRSIISLRDLAEGMYIMIISSNSYSEIKRLKILDE